MSKKAKFRRRPASLKCHIIRKDYIKRLIAGVRKSIDEDPLTIKVCKIAKQRVIPARWIDAAILCDVVEKEVLKI